nr:methyltransferase domain-containing protein [Nakamurella flavida]
MLDLIGSERSVLDVGCASGYLAGALVERGCTVSGVEYDEVEAEKARPVLDRLVVADLNQVELGEQFPPASFDVLVFGDVLEHLLDPVAVLRSSLRLLRPGGTVVISVPNVSHGSVRLALLQGRWRYTPTGLLDRTHIRFFTRRSLVEMLTDVGLQVVRLRGTSADALGTEVAVDAAELPADAVHWVRQQRDADTYQFVVSAALRPEGGDGADGTTVVQETRIELSTTPAAPPRDVHTELAEATSHLAGARAEVDAVRGELDAVRGELDAVRADLGGARATITALRREALGQRDFVIGCEAQVGRMRYDVGQAVATAVEARRDATYAHSELAKSIADSQNAHRRLAETIAELQEARLRSGGPGPRPGGGRVRSAARSLLGPTGWRVATTPVRVARRVVRGAR